MQEITTYLKKLKFDPSLENTLIGKYLKNQRLLVLIVLLIITAGIFSYRSIPRVLNPQVKIPIVIVSTILPGAGPKDIESLVTVPLEEGLNNLSRVKTMSSTSQDSASIITLEFESGVDPEKAKSDVQSEVDNVTSLPKDARAPKVQKLDFENQPIWIFSVTSNGDEASLMRFSRMLRDQLNDLSTIDKVDTNGLDQQEIQVLIKPQAITTYGVNPMVLSQAISSAIGSFPAGSINTSNSSFVLTIDPTITTVDELRKLRITVGGGMSAGSSAAMGGSQSSNTVLLSDIATISLRPKPDAALSYVADNDDPAMPSVNFNVYKKSTANITSAVKDSQNLANKLAADYHGNIKISTVINTGDQINRQFNELVRDLLITVGLVFLILFIFLGVRQAIVSSLSIPFTFLITFTVMNLTGIAFSFIAFFSLLLSLGLLVDDTIVVISAISAYYRSGKFTPLQAGLLVWRDFITAITTTTLTTVWAFVPLLLSSGIIGEFIKPIPIVVSSTLLGSYIVALFITLPLIVILLEAYVPKRVVILARILLVAALFGLFLFLAPKDNLFIPAIVLFFINLFIYFQIRKIIFSRIRQRLGRSSTASATVPDKQEESAGSRLGRYISQGVISFDVIGRKYRRIIDVILSNKANRRKAVIMVVLFSLLSYTLLPLGFVRNEFFPKSDNEYMYVSLEMPAGTKLSKTNEEALKIVNDIRQIPEVKVVSFTPRLTIMPGRGYGSAGDNYALVTIVLPTEHERDISSMDIAQEIRNKYADYQKGTISVVEVSGGPPAGSDLQIKLFGENLGQLDVYADSIQNHLKTQPGVTNINKTIKAGTSKIVFTPNYQNMLDAGITQDQAGFWLRTFASGFTLDTNVKLEENVANQNGLDIILRTDPKPQTALALDSISVSTPKGVMPLSSLGTYSLKPNPTMITRENGKRTISVTASVIKGYSVSESNTDLEKFANTLNLSEGYSWETGGVNEENQNSVNSILQAMLFSFFLIIITIVLQFSSFRKAVIVMLVIPLSISGVFIIFALTHTPLSFPALIGILALFGIVVKNSILVVDKINANLASGLSFKEAIVDAAESRLEPIALTSFTAIIGLVPITLSNPLWQGLGGAIIAGLVFSGTIMLFFIPVVYYLIFASSEGKKYK